MALKDLKGRTVEINFIPDVNLDFKTLAERMVTDLKGLRLSSISHREAVAKWVIGIAEEQIERFVERLQRGDSKATGVMPHLTPSQIRKQGGRAIAMMTPGGTIQVSDKDKGTSTYGANNSAVK